MSARGSIFRYAGWSFEAHDVVCSYDLDGRGFTERITLPDGPGHGSAALAQVARLLFLLAGVSYYKTAAPATVDLDDTAVTDADRALLQAFYRDGLGEFAYVNGLDLSHISFVGGAEPLVAAPYDGDTERPLIPFGGGIDSVVVAETVRARHPQAALFVLGSYEAIDGPLAVTGLPVLRAGRTLDPQVLARDPAFLNGHVPVTGILSLVALAAAVVDGRGAVVMSNEHSASEATVAGVNHQWSKSMAFERLLRASLAEAVPGLGYFSLLRARSELWVARRFALLPAYHPVFRSCNRAFHLDPARRLGQWCGECDKCCFIDLILAPYLARTELEAVFHGREPLGRTDLLPQFRSLLGDAEIAKPFECVGDVDECRTAVVLAAARADRQGQPVLSALAEYVDGGAPSEDSLLRPLGVDFVPGDYAQADLPV
ncbi:MAG TPA: hypothetical protein VIJ71_03145 [Mycobacteriales bacterium]